MLKRDASDTGLGVVLTQNAQPIAFASRALCDIETRYTQIEKDFLAVVFGPEKFHQYTYGCPLTVQSDRKPLEIIAKKLLHRVPKGFQRVLLRLLVYDVNLVYRCGKQMELADTISRTYHPNMDRSPFETVLLLLCSRSYSHDSRPTSRCSATRGHTEPDRARRNSSLSHKGYPI